MQFPHYQVMFIATVTNHVTACARPIPKSRVVKSNLRIGKQISLLNLIYLILPIFYLCLTPWSCGCCRFSANSKNQFSQKMCCAQWNINGCMRLFLTHAVHWNAFQSTYLYAYVRVYVSNTVWRTNPHTACLDFTIHLS